MCSFLKNCNSVQNTDLHVHACYKPTLQQIDSLIEKMDPESSGHISFLMFQRGVESYLTGKQPCS